jgi:carbon-monoxide dehydrogenase medium subunit
MKPSTFEYHAPETISEVVGLLRDVDDAKVLAGGQSLVPMLALRMARFGHLIDLAGVEELRGVECRDDGVRIGAMTTQAEIERDADIAHAVPLLARATPLIGHFQIRNRGTIGGSLAHADAAAEYPAVAVALKAEIEIIGPGGDRRVPARDFFISPWTTVLADDEVVKAVRFPSNGGSAGYAIEEVARRHGDFALAGVACAIEVSDDIISSAGFGLFGLAYATASSPAAEAALSGTAVGDVDVAEIARLTCTELDPPADIHASSAYRKHLATGIVARALTRALKEASHA